MSCTGNCNNCSCEDYIETFLDKYGPRVDEYDNISYNFDEETSSLNAFSYKYAENIILADLKAHLDKTYSEHYATDNNIECFDAWIALGDSTPTFRNTALKYLWRYGKKNGNNKQDLMKALHYIFMCLYVDHYKKDEK